MNDDDLLPRHQLMLCGIAVAFGFGVVPYLLSGGADQPGWDLLAVIVFGASVALGLVTEAVVWWREREVSAGYYGHDDL